MKCTVNLKQPAVKNLTMKFMVDLKQLAENKSIRTKQPVMRALTLQQQATDVVQL
jgi:hypothetical protein